MIKEFTGLLMLIAALFHDHVFARMIPCNGWVCSTTPTLQRSRVVQFRDALRELGYVEGQNLILKERHADGALNRLPPERQAVVTSLARPSRNLTGFLHMSSDLAAKPLALLCEIFSKCIRVAALYDPLEPATEAEVKETKAGARSLGVTLEAIAVRSLTDLEQALATAVHGGVQGMLVFTHGFAVLNRGRIMELAARWGVPVLYGWRDFVDEGG